MPLLELLTCARPYSIAAFSYAKQQDQIEQWHKMLSLCHSIFINEKIQSLLSSYQYNKKEKISIFIDICKDSVSNEFINFLKIIFSNNRIHLLPVILQQFIKQKMEINNQKFIKIISILKLNDQQLNKIVKKIEKKLNCGIIAENIVDQSILGGFIIVSEDTVIDLSLKTKISQLKNKIID